MILGQYKPDYSNLKLDFGQCFQVYENTRNGMMPSNVGGSSPIPENDRGSYYFMSLKIGRRIHVR